MAKNKPVYIGEVTGNNIAVPPERVIEMISEDLARRNPNPVKGMIALVIREDEHGTVHIDTYRCGLPKFVEIGVLHRAFQHATETAIREG